jgi:hypothetical protein
MSENQSGGVTGVYISFVDVLFSVIVATSFTRFYPITLDFQTFTVILAYTTVVASWVGYHKDFLKGLDKYVGPYRFVIDLILIYLYNYLINSFKDFRLMLFIFPIIFGFYVLWELSRYFESGRSRQVVIKIILNGIFLILFLIQLAVYLSTESYVKSGDLVGISPQTLQWAFWTTSMTMIIVYRVTPSTSKPPPVNPPTNKKEVT